MKKLLLYLGVVIMITSCSDVLTEPITSFSIDDYNLQKGDTLVARNNCTNYDSVNWYLDNVKISNSSTSIKIANNKSGYHDLKITAFRKKTPESYSNSFYVILGNGNYTFWGADINSEYTVYIKKQSSFNYNNYYDKQFFGPGVKPNCNPGYNSGYGESITEGTYDYKCVIYNYNTWTSTTKYGTFTIIPDDCVYIQL